MATGGCGSTLFDVNCVVYRFSSDELPCQRRRSRHRVGRKTENNKKKKHRNWMAKTAKPVITVIKSFVRKSLISIWFGSLCRWPWLLFATFASFPCKIDVSCTHKVWNVMSWKTKRFIFHRIDAVSGLRVSGYRKRGKDDRNSQELCSICRYRFSIMCKNYKFPRQHTEHRAHIMRPYSMGTLSVEWTALGTGNDAKCVCTRKQWYYVLVLLLLFLLSSFVKLCIVHTAHCTLPCSIVFVPVIINDWSWIYFLPLLIVRSACEYRCMCRMRVLLFFLYRHHCGRRHWLGIRWRQQKKILYFYGNKLLCFIIYRSYACRLSRSSVLGAACSIFFCRMQVITASFQMGNNKRMWFSKLIHSLYTYFFTFGRNVKWDEK